MKKVKPLTLKDIEKYLKKNLKVKQSLESHAGHTFLITKILLNKKCICEEDLRVNKKMRWWDFVTS